jgi:hypothetical protein
MQARSKGKSSALFQRLERLRRHRDLTWGQVAEQLGVSVPMLMMVKAGARNLSEKVLARLDWAEVEAGLRSPSRLSEAARAFGKRKQIRAPLVTEADIEKGYFDFRPGYQPGIGNAPSPGTIRLTRPSIEGRNRLGMVMAKSFDSDVVILACLPIEQRNQAFLNSLALASRNSLHDAAMTLVFGTDWRVTVANLAVESRIGDEATINQILGKEPSSS